MKTGLVKYAVENVRKRKLRSWLTVLSIVIGIAAITALISFGQGIQGYMQEIAEKMGDDKLIVQPKGFGFGPPSLETDVALDEDDVKAIERVHGVAEATGMYVLSGEVKFNDQVKYGYIIGSDIQEHRELIEEVYALDIAEGRPLRGNEKSEVVLGYNYKEKDKIFEKPVRLRDKIVVNGIEMKVQGFYEEVGNPSDDANIYVPADAAEQLFHANNFYWILARTQQGVDAKKLAKEVKEELRDHRHQKEGAEDFFVQTFDEIIATFSTVLSVITGVVVLIALISIFVAAVNMTNTTYTAVLERTKEIGVMKAIGARNRDILFIFVAESGVLGIIGGCMGVLLGYIIAKFAGKMVAEAGYAVLTPVFTAELVIGSILFAGVVGILSGFIPSYQASKLNPVDALRYE